MATYYIDAVAGNDANSGLTEALAKKTIQPLCGTLAAGDIIRLKYYVSDSYDLLTSFVGTCFTSIFITRYASDTLKPKLKITRGSGSSAAYAFAGANLFANLDLEWTFTSSSRVADFWGANASLYIYHKNCKVRYNYTSTGSNINIRPLRTSTDHIYVFEDCEFDMENIGASTICANFFFNNSSCKFIRNTMYNARITNASTTSLIAGVGGVEIAYNKIQGEFINTTAGVRSAVIGLNATIANCYKNTMYLTAAGDGIHAAFLVSGASGQFLGQAFDNIIYKADTNGNFYDYTSSATITITNPEMLLIGNNAVYNRTALAENITGMKENYGSSIIISGNPFLSISPASSDFLKLDTSLAAALALIDQGYFDPDSNIGFDGVDPSAGAVPNAYDLRAGVTVGLVTGTLVIPANTDVRAGVNYDVAPNAKTGLLNLPAEADVKVGVSYDNGTKTGSFDYLTLFSDPGVANVKTGVDYKYNSATNNRTGTYTAYPLLNVTDVKHGVDRGDTQVGTYRGADLWTAPQQGKVIIGGFYKDDGTLKQGTYKECGTSNVRNGITYGEFGVQYEGTLIVPEPNEVIKDLAYDTFPTQKIGTLESTDPGVANVVSGINYKINSTSYTGTRTAIYSVLAANLVKFGIDRGDGQLGTDKGESFNSALTASQIAIGESIQNLGNTVVGSYTASERYSLLNESDVKDGVAFTYNNVDYTGSYLAYPLLALDVVKSGEDRGDGQLGTYTAEERYTLIPENKVEINFNYLYNNEEFTGSFAGGGATDYPLEEKVLFPTVYAFGLKTGTLGKYNTTNLDIAKQLQTNAELVLTNVLGSEFTALKYFKEVEKNDFYSITKQYGIRPKDVVMLKDVIGKDTADITFEIKLTTDFDNRDADDAERLAELYLIEKMEAIRRQLRVTKFGNFTKVRIIRDFNQLECEKVGDRVILCRAEITVSFSAE